MDAGLKIVITGIDAGAAAMVAELNAAFESFGGQVAGAMQAATAAVSGGSADIVAANERAAASFGAIGAAAAEAAAAVGGAAATITTEMTTAGAAAASVGDGAAAGAAQIEAADAKIEVSATQLAATMRSVQAEVAASYQLSAAAATQSAEEQAAAMSALRTKMAADMAAMRTGAEAAAVSTAAVGAAGAASTGGLLSMGAAASRGGAVLSGMAGVVGMTSKQLLMTGAAAAVVAGATVKMAGDFESSTQRLVSSAGEVSTNLDMVRKGILAMAGQVGVSAEDLSAAMYKIESGGQHGADGLKVLQAAAEGAKTENASLTEVGDAVTTMLIDYHLKADSAAEVTSKMVTATAQGKMTFQELASSLSSLAPIASAAHVSIDDMLGTLAAMTQHGISAQQATQNLADGIRHLQAPTDVSRKEMALFGISADEVASHLGERGLAGTMQYLQQAVMKAMPPGSDKVILELRDAADASAPAVKALAEKVVDGTMSWTEYRKEAGKLPVELQGNAMAFANLGKATHQLGTENKDGATVIQTYAGAMQKLMGDATGLKDALMTTGENAGNANKAIKAIADTSTEAGDHVKGWEGIQATFNQKMAECEHALGSLAITVGTMLLPAVTMIANALADGAKWLTEHQAAATALAVILGGILLGALIAVGAAVLAATWPFLLIGVAIAGLIWLVKVIIDNWDVIGQWFVDLWNTVSGAFTDAVKWCGDRIDDFIGFVKAIPGNIGAALQQAADWVGQKLADIGAWFAGLPGQIGEALVQLGSTILSGLGKIGEALFSPFRGGWDKVVDLFHKSPGEIMRELGHMAGEIVGTGLRMMLDWGQTIKDGLAAVQKWWNELPIKIGQALVELGDTLVKAGADMWNNYINWNIEQGHRVVAWFKGLGKMIDDALVGAGQWLVKTATDMWDGFIAWNIRQGHAVEDWFKALPDRITAVLANAGLWLVKTGMDLLQGFLDSITEGYKAVNNWWLMLPYNIGKFFLDAGSWLLQAGKDILNGLWDGIKSVFGTIMDGITNFAGGFVDGFKDAMGIKSPSTIMAENGKYIMEGLGQGIDAQQGSVVANVVKVPQQIVAAFASSKTLLVQSGTDVMAGLGTGMDQGQQKITAGVSAFVTKVGQSFTELTTTVTAQSTQLNTSLDTMNSEFVKLGSTLDTAAPRMTAFSTDFGIFGATIAQAGPPWTKFVTDVGSFSTRVGEAVPAWEKFTTGFQQWVAQLQQAGELWSIFVARFIQFATSLAAVSLNWTKFVNDVVLLTNNMKLVTPLWTNYTNAFVTFTANLKIASPLWTKFVNDIVAFTAQIKVMVPLWIQFVAQTIALQKSVQILGPLWTKLVTDFTTFSTQLRQIVAPFTAFVAQWRVWQTILTAILPLWTLFVTNMRTWDATLIVNLPRFVQWLQLWIQWRVLLTQVVPLVLQLNTHLTNTGKIMVALLEVFKVFIAGLVAVGQAFIDLDMIVTEAMKQMAKNIIDILQILLQVFSDFVTGVIQGWHDFLQAMIDLTAQGMKLVHKEFTDQLAKILKELQKAEKDFEKAGQQVGEGFAKGIESKEGRVKEAAQKLAAAAASALAMAAMIASPSKITTEMGGYWAEGFALGMDAQHTRVARSARDLVMAAKKAADQQLASMAGQSGNGSVMSSNNVVAYSPSTTNGPLGSGVNGGPTVHVYIDGQEFKGIVRTELAGHDKALRRAVAVRRTR